MHGVLAGAPGPQTSPATAIAVAAGLLLASVAAVTVRVLVSSGRLRRQATARAAARTADATATWPVRLRTQDFFAMHGPGLDMGRVSLRGEFIEVTQGPVARKVNGREYYFPVREAWLGIEPGAFRGQWLVITGTSGGEPALVAVSPAGGRPAVEQMWHTLVAAGARQERAGGE
jgi:hypothetical protein